MVAVFAISLVILSSETARSFLQDAFAQGSVVFFDNMTPILAAVGALSLICIVLSLRSKASKDLSSAPSLMAMNRNVDDVKNKSDIYTTLHATGGGTKSDRVDHCQDMVNQYYDLATDFYEFGWGESFHFAPRHAHETFNESILRHEYYLAGQLSLKKGMRVLDVGCGVGGPARNIARFSGAKVVGLNNNAYQIRRGTAKNAKQGVSDLVSFVKGDFMAMPFKDGEFDAVYAVEATCHAPDRVGCFKEIMRCLKPGGTFCCYEWAMTDKYDPSNAHHVELKEGIEVGNGLPDVNTIPMIVDCMRKAGFEDVAAEDVAEPNGRPSITWYAPFAPSMTLSGFKTSAVGIFLTNVMVRGLELLRLAPAGSHQMHSHLSTGARTLWAGGAEGIFTPMLLLKGRKPTA